MDNTMQIPEGNFGLFLKRYALRGPAYRRRYYPLMVGLAVLARLEELHEADRFDAENVRWVLGRPVREQLGPREWVVLGGVHLRSAAERFVGHFAASDGGFGYGWLWRRACELLETPT